jgi:hypothetical protein
MLFGSFAVYNTIGRGRAHEEIINSSSVPYVSGVLYPKPKHMQKLCHTSMLM